uniref:non-specific serine/threonine protein kinase n=1 Tax=Arcella intermedia TaxID=1963864 RepID=A0A6B2L3Q9_9EUKA
MSYYTNESKKKKQGEILHKDILDVYPVDPDYKGKKFVFCITTKAPLNRPYYIQAGDNDSRGVWIKSVQQLIFEAVVDDINEARGGRKKTETGRKICYDDFERMRCIGRGGFGKVLLVKMKSTGEIYAMKILKKEFVIATKQVDHTHAERNVLVRVEHPFLPKLYYAFQDSTNLYFVMDFINGGELFFHLRKEKKFSEDRTKFYAAQIVTAISYLHSIGIIYRDLKPENILLTKSGDVVVTDFGLAKEGLHGPKAETETRAGTPEYLAPEVIIGQKYTKAVDWWSVGVLIFEMLFGYPPFLAEGIQQLFEKITKEPHQFPKPTSPEAVDIINKFLTKDPTKRLCDSAKIMAHPWFKSIDWKKLVKKEIAPPFVPKVNNEMDVSNVDENFLNESVEDKADPPGGHNRAISVDQLFVGFTFSPSMNEEIKN